jgi:hypothetical protein
MIEAVITIVILLLTFAVYKIWIKPIRLMNRYVKLLKDRGYKVLRIPYHPINAHFQYVIQKGIDQGDALKLYKDDFQGYDVVVGNFFL